MSGKTKRNFGKPSNVKTNIASVMEYKNQLTQYTYAIIPKGDSVTEVFYNSSHSFGPEELHLFFPTEILIERGCKGDLIGQTVK